MTSNGINRRHFVRRVGLAAAAAALNLRPGTAGATPAPPCAFSDYDRYDGLGLAELVKARKVSAGELLEAALARVERLNPTLNAIVYPMYDQARAAIAAGLPSGPFTGVPYLLKDLGLFYAGTVSTFGSRALRKLVPDHDSEMVTRMKRAGLVIFGKTHSPEFGLSTSSESRLFGATRNPWKVAYSPGGSSGGSAVAVASGMVPMANGNDGGGSLRIPASCCGLFGLKPTRARTPVGPDLGEWWSGLSISHALTRSVRDSAALLDATAGPELGDPYWAPPIRRPYLDEVGAAPGRLRIAFTTQPWNLHQVDPECVNAATAAAALCERLGHYVELASPTIDQAALAQALEVIMASQTRALLDWVGPLLLGREVTADDVEAVTWRHVEYARQLSASDYAGAINTMHGTGRVVSGFFTRYDLLLTPTMCTPPHKLGVVNMMNPDFRVFDDAVAGDAAFTQLFNASGNPAMSVPLHWTPEGIPVGVQFAAPFGDEARLFRLAAQLEAAQPWAGRRPAPKP